MADFVEEFSQNESVRRFFDVFSKSPPAEVIDSFEILVGTLKEWDVLLHPFPGFSIGNMIGNILGLHAVEEFNVMLKGISIQYVYRIRYV